MEIQHIEIQGISAPKRGSWVSGDEGEFTGDKDSFQNIRLNCPAGYPTAEKAADITTLYPPTGRFKDSIKNAVTYLANTGRAVTVRVAWRIVSGDVDEFARYITAASSGVAGSAVKVYVARYISGALNWNHSKIIAADQGATQGFVNSFWNNMWGYSLRHAVTGNDMPAGRACSLLE